eukprot:6172779-Pleurochrysis_carterae.AAC.2
MRFEYMRRDYVDGDAASLLAIAFLCDVTLRAIDITKPTPKSKTSKLFSTTCSPVECMLFRSGAVP